ncbi:hypothetical protein niasHT_019431 [Heterodera trifolii]|uniref:Gustatory receptor n=1 Tax=Heterodera trifolii TaxID=157864 RepID=A0ABD2KWP8_9BILA
MNSSVLVESGFQLEMPILFALSGIEMLLNLVELPTSGINIYLIGRTPMIHRNLKFILLYQSAWIFTRSFARFFICLLKFVSGNALFSEQLQPFRFAYQLSAYNRNFVPHILIIERFMATFWRKNYERSVGWHFSLGWSSLVFFVALYNSLSTSTKNTSLSGLITTFVLLLLGFVELFVFIWLWHYNKTAYMKSLANVKLHCLTERYQLSENIRIGKQLMPTVILQLVNVLATSVYLSITNFGISVNQNISAMVVVTVTTLCGLLIEVTMITHHPFLRRNLRQILCKFASKLSVRRGQVHSEHSHRRMTTAQNEAAAGISAAAHEGIAMRDIIRGQILTRGEGDHFAMLKDIWEKGAMATKKAK